MNGGKKSVLIDNWTDKFNMKKTLKMVSYKKIWYFESDISQLGIEIQNIINFN